MQSSLAHGRADTAAPPARWRRHLDYHLAFLALALPVLVHRLDNDLTCVLAESRSAGVVAVQAWVGVGSADETPGQAGIAHVFEHMLFKGTARRGVGAMAREVESVGGEMNAWTSFDNTVYHVTLASQHLDLGLDVLADALGAAAFEPAELERERKVILEEIRQGKDDPGRAAAHALFRTAFTRHPYGRPVIGHEDVVTRLGVADLRRFLATWYGADNLTLVVTGDFDETRTLARVAHHFGRLPRGRGVRARPALGPQRTLRHAIERRELACAELWLGFRAPGHGHDELAGLDVLSVVLGQGESSRLCRDLVRERELAVGVHGYLHPMRDAGILVTSAAVVPDKLDRAAAAIGEILFGLADRPLEPRELDKARHAIWADLVYQQETVDGLARRLGQAQVTTGDADFERRYLERVQRVTADEVRALAARYLRPEHASVAMVLPTGRGGARVIERFARAGQPVRARRAHAASPARRRELREVVLPGGAHLIIRRDPSVAMVSLRAVWTGGILREPAKQAGLANLLAATLTRGCGGRSAEDIISEIDDRAGSLSGFAGRNSLGLRGEFLSRDFAAGFALFADCLTAPRFEAAEVEREKRRIKDDLDARDDNPSSVAFRLFLETIYPAHPYRRDVLGTAATVAALTARDLRAHFATQYPLSAVTIAVVGDVDPDEVIALARQRLVGKPVARPAVSHVVDDPGARPAEQREVYRYMDRAQAQLVVGFPGATLDDPDHYALELLATILGGQGGRLFVALRDRQALVYRVGAVSIEGIDPGYVAVYLAASPDKIDAALASVHAELDRLRDTPVGRDELDRAVEYLLGSRQMAMQRRSAVAAALASYQAYGLGTGELDRYAARLRKVDPAALRRVATRYLDWSRAVTATVTPRAASPAAERRGRGVRKRTRPRGGKR